jgi:threonine/homoserine/homoserine lactone efflux protein
LDDNRGVVVPHLSALEVFAVASIALLLVPGPAVLYVVTQSAEHGRRAGLASVAGIHLGTTVHIAAATVGLSALVVASATAFTAVKLAGAVYLVYVGIRKLLEREPPLTSGLPSGALRKLFVQGVVVNVLNPKTALFFLAFLPQFVDRDRGAVWSQVLILGALFMLLGFVSDSLYALTAGTIAGALRRRRTVFRYGSGAVFIGLGTVAALAKRN